MRKLILFVFFWTLLCFAFTGLNLLYQLDTPYVLVSGYIIGLLSDFIADELE